jgi:sugar phosphate isomerase/epimerase
MRRDQIALQLYTVRRPAADDLPGTLREVATAGYRSVELAGLPPGPVATLRSLLDDAGLQVIAAHHSLDEVRTNLAAVLERLIGLGCPRLIVASLPERDRSSPASVRRAAEDMGRAGDSAAGMGIEIGFHNHAVEFEVGPEGSAWDMLLETLPASVAIELDVYWASIAGQDPVQLIDALGGRVRLLHMKDMAPGPARTDAAPGDGVLPWPRIVEAGRRAAVAWYIVEQDEPDDPMPAARRGLDHLRTLATT